MKILWIDYDDLHNPYANGGQAYMTREIVSRLAKNNEIKVLTGNYPNAINTKTNHLSYDRLGIGNFGYFASMISHWLLLPLYILKNQSHYDVIVECFTAPFTTSLIPLVSKKPLVALPTFMDSEKLAEKYHLPLDIFKKLLLKKYKNFIVLTEEIKKKIVAINSRANCTVIPGGVDDEIHKSKPLPGKYGLYLGRIDIYNKGLDVLLEAWRDIQYPLIIAGSGRDSEISKIKDLIVKYSLSDRVKLIGYQKGRKKVELLRNSKFVVQLSRYETFGFVALEVLAAGKPLICTNIEGYKWIPKDNAIKVNNYSVKEVKNSIETVINTNKIKTKSSINKHNYWWDAIASRYLNSLNEQLLQDLPRVGDYLPYKLLTPTNQSGIFKYCLYRNSIGKIGFAKYAIKGNYKAKNEIKKEIFSNKIISINQSKSSPIDDRDIKIVKVIGSVINNDIVMIMSEFVDGSNLSTISFKKQVAIYEHAIQTISGISKDIHGRFRNNIQTKTMFRYFVINKILLLKILLTNKIPWKTYLQLNIKNIYAFINYINSGYGEYGFVHGDLVNNILIDKRNFAYLYDFQTYMFTNSQYELASIYTSVSDIKVFNELSKIDKYKKINPILLLYCGTYNYIDGTITKNRYECILNLVMRN